MQLRLPFRNLMRHRARTMMSVSAIAFGVISMLLAGGFIQWIFWAMRDSTIHAQLGHIQVVAPGYHRMGLADPFNYLLPLNGAEIGIIESMPEVSLVAPRISFSGLVSFGDASIPFVAEGVDVDKETELSRELRVAEGAGLSDERDNEVLLGIGLARNLGAGPGDTTVLLVSTASGGINAAEVRVSGLFSTSSKAYDDTTLRVPHVLANRLLRVDGTHRWIVLLENTEDTEQLIGEFRERFTTGSGELEFVPWHQLADFYNKTVALFSRQMNVLWVLIALIIVLTISNTLIRGMMERTGEIGTLMALGARRAEILRLFLGEGLLLGAIGGAVGLLVGMALATGISSIGIPMPPPPGMSQGFMGEILVTGELAVAALVMAMTTSLLASVYPARKAARLVIVDALRHNR